ncbi:SdpI family protein [Candidatus Fermentibacteria bacterium]|nr:SdpI family protein [Candidatus Fermentibacteria bacterium]
MPAGRAITLIVGVIGLAFIITMLAYPRLPDRIASHWNAAGDADGWMAKAIGVFLIPVTMLGVAALCTLLPLIDPLKRNIAVFRPYYDTFLILILLFLLVIQLQILFWNLGTKISPNRLLPIPFGILIYYAGVLIQHAKRNWFVGVRTPWTLRSDRVWDQTHRVTGALFRVCGVISVIGFAFGDRWLWCVMAPLILVTLFSVTYSYALFRKEQQKG